MARCKTDGAPPYPHTTWRKNNEHHSPLMTAPVLHSAAITTVATIITCNTPATLAHRLRAHLQARAAQRAPSTYHEAATALRLAPPNTIHQLTQALEQLMAEDAAADRPFIAAMVIGKSRGGLPAPGFFDCAAQLGRFTGDAAGPGARVFHAMHRDAVAALWAAPGESLDSE